MIDDLKANSDLLHRQAIGGIGAVGTDGMSNSATGGDAGQSDDGGAPQDDNSAPADDDMGGQDQGGDDQGAPQDDGQDGDDASALLMELAYYNMHHLLMV